MGTYYRTVLVYGIHVPDADYTTFGHHEYEQPDIYLPEGLNYETADMDDYSEGTVVFPESLTVRVNDSAFGLLFPFDGLPEVTVEDCSLLREFATQHGFEDNQRWYVVSSIG